MRKRKLLSWLARILTAVMIAAAGQTLAPPAAIAASPCVPDSGQFRYEYWAGTDTTVTPTATHCGDPLPKADWGITYPEGPDANVFTVKWTGTVKFPAGSYKFSATAQDQATVTMDGIPVFQSPTPGSPTLVTAGDHTLVVAYQHTSPKGTPANLKFSWQVVDSQGQADSCPGQWGAKYYHGDGDFAFSQCVASPSGIWSAGTNPWLGNDYAVTFSAKQRFRQDTYDFTATGQGRAILKLNGNAVFDREVTPSAPVTVPYPVAGLVPVELTYKTRISPTTVTPPPHSVSLSWSPNCASGDWKASYYENESATGTPNAVQCEARPDYRWDAANTPSPWAARAAPAALSATWQRSVHFPAGWYRFRLETDGTASLGVSGPTPLSAPPGPLPVTTVDKPHTFDLQLAEGDYQLALKYKTNVPGRIGITWESMNGDPGGASRCAAGTYLAEYTRFGSTSPALATCEVRSSDWGMGAPESWGNTDYGARWTSDIWLMPGSYTFEAVGASPWQAQLNGVEIFARNTGTGPMPLAGGPYHLEATGNYSSSAPITNPIDLRWTSQVPAAETCSSGFALQYYSGMAPAGAPLTTVCSPALPPVVSQNTEPAAWNDGPTVTLVATGGVDLPEDIYHFSASAPGAQLTLGTHLAIIPTGATADLNLVTGTMGPGVYNANLQVTMPAGAAVPTVWWENEARPRIQTGVLQSDRFGNGATVTLTFDRDVQLDRIGNGDFLVNYSDTGQKIDVRDVSITGKTATLSLVQSVLSNQPVWVAYVPGDPRPVLTDRAIATTMHIPLALNARATSGNLQDVISGVYKTALTLPADGSTTWQANLNGPYTLDQIRIVTGSAAGLDGTLRVSVSSDGTTFTEVAQLNAGQLTATGDRKELSFAPRLAGHIRLDYAGTGPGLPIKELRLYGNPAGTTVGWLSLPPLVANAAALQLSTAELAVNMIELAYGDAMLDATSVPQASQFNVRIGNGIPFQPISVQVYENKVRLYLGRDIPFGPDAVTLDYTPSTRPIRDKAYRNAQSLTAHPVDKVLTTPLNLVTWGSAVSQSGTFNSDLPQWGPGRGVDGNTATAFNTGPGTEPWWLLTLNQRSTLLDLTITNAPGATAAQTSGLQVQLSLDGTEWTQVYTHSGEPFQTLHIDLHSTKAKYVRIALAGNASLSLGEIELTGYPQ